jgi:uncharacterized protein (DUF2237 family)
LKVSDAPLVTASSRRTATGQCRQEVEIPRASNDLSTPHPEYDFPGLQPVDQWCLCATRWKHAFDAGKAPRVKLESAHISALEFILLEDLQRHALADD